MGLFSTILEKLGLKKEKEETAPAAASTPAAAAPKAEVKPAAAAPAKPAAPATSAARPMKDDRAMEDPKPAAPKAISEVDVVSKLEKLAAENPAQLNWKVSIVDLLKLLGLDSSGAARKELAEELGCPADQMSDSARMNVWLHKTVLKKIAENGGNIPADLLD
ncbi:MAG: DUF3597 domain-containing protein [Anaerolineales bacterium]